VREAFETLGLSPAWSLPAQAVRDAQRRVAARWHPDRFADAAERDAAQRRVAKANEAAATLVDPLARGQALLELFAPVPRLNDARPQPAFLMQMMSLREAIDGGDVGVQDELEALRAQAEADAERLFGRLVGGDSSAWPEAGEALGRLRAVRRAREALQQ
jgi:molecular chaperone HscB